MTTATKDYLTCAETAALVRKALKRHFPDISFSVRSKTYSGGASIDVSWTDGPLTREVDAVTAPFSGADFDGMIDLKVSRTAWLEDNGESTIAFSPGTNGSMSEYIGSRRTPGARLVHFGADYIFTNRHITNEETKREAARAWITEHCITSGEGRMARFGEHYVDDLATGIVYGSREGESIAAAFEREAWRTR